MWWIRVGIIFVAGVIIIFLVVILEFLYRKNTEKIKFRNQQVEKYKKGLKRLESQSSYFGSFSKLVKGFFNEAYGLKKNLSYLELFEEFHKKNMKEEAALCKHLSNSLYSGGSSTRGDLKKQTNIFKKILKKHY